MTTELSPPAVVHSWLAAANVADADGVLRLSAPDVEIIGPRGVARGRDVLRDWLVRANVSFETRRMFARADRVVVDQHGLWRTSSSEPAGEADVATRFVVHGSQVRQIQRYDSLAEALAHAGLTEADAFEAPRVDGAAAVTSPAVQSSLPSAPSSLPAAQRAFLESTLARLRSDVRIVGLAIGGSYLSDTMDEFSDLDLIVVVEAEEHASVLARGADFASQLGPLLSAFTGEHVGEPRLLICLFGPPLLHVDLKFVSPRELRVRVEDPVVLWERDGRVSLALSEGTAEYPAPDATWLEDRFWVWVHYAATKLARGELFEVVQFLGYLRGAVLGPLGLQSVGARPNGVRRIETHAPHVAHELDRTLAGHDARECARALRASVELYRALRSSESVSARRASAEQAALEYLSEVERRIGS